jgi:hypothetical protein
LLSTTLPRRRVQALTAELGTASTRLADLRRRGMKIYTLALDIVFSAVSAPERRPLNLAAVVTLSAGGGVGRG